MHALIKELYPICRSITGNGVRESLNILKGRIPIEIHEIPTGQQVFDWTVPLEWNIRDAYIKAPDGNKIVDFKINNLHVVSYSIPVNKIISLAELKKHCHTLPNKPNAIPYRTSYYQPTWGFCLPHRQLELLSEGDYEVVIDSTLEPGHLTFGELFIQGDSDEEALFSAHICHPSLCNDNLSGLALLTELAGIISKRHSRRYSCRFLFAPGTIGAITWLALRKEHTKKIKHGLVVACVGDNGKMHYKKSRQGKAEIDRAVMHTLSHSGQQYEVHDFSPYGYDERQYCSPGFNLAVGSLTRTPHGRYPEYHTSDDNPGFVTAEALADSLDKYIEVIDLLESNYTYLNTNPFCEPQLGKRGLYRSMGGLTEAKTEELAMLWVLNLSDGCHSLLDIAERSNLPYQLIRGVADRLIEHGLLTKKIDKSAD
ncbi:MAG: DUF4910 domain-containing protein [candidate division Zixibacteria bacterium]|nr:DUF4910 domain-containing protein [candidate division Zixibacteria bacterium]